MWLDWILSPIGLYAFLTLALFCCLALFLSMKREIALVRRSSTGSRDAAEASAATLAAQLAALRKDMQSNEAPSSPGQELNLTRRAQALRMQRRGEFKRIADAARADLRAAAERIRVNRADLARYRAGELADPERRLELMDFIDRHGDLPRYAARTRTSTRGGAQGGGGS